jgi:fermentation-respiration switch protein FrsA (DUF1100 family)
MGIVENHAFHPPPISSYGPNRFNTLHFQISQDGKAEQKSMGIPYTFYLSGSGRHLVTPTKQLANKTTILYFHGNACDIGSLASYGKHICTTCGANFVAIEYPGYGHAKTLTSNDADEQSTSIKTSENWIYCATDEILRELRNVWGIDESNIILMGKSIGSGPAVEFATRQKFKGLIVDSGFTSCARIKVTLPAFLQWISDATLDIFVNVKKLPHVKCKVMLIHSKADDIVPFDHAEKNWSQIPEEFRAKYLALETPTHNAVEYLHNQLGRLIPWKFNDEYFAEIRNFVSK